MEHEWQPTVGHAILWQHFNFKIHRKQCYENGYSYLGQVKRHIQILDVAVPNDWVIKEAERMNFAKYQDLKNDFCRSGVTRSAEIIPVGVSAIKLRKIYVKAI